MPHSHACPDCLRRAHLLALLGPYIERFAIRENRSQSPTALLAKSSGQLAQTVAPQVAEQLLARVDALPERTMREEQDAACCWATCPHEESYPEALRDLWCAPATIFGRGERSHLDRLTLSDSAAVVGSRRATAHGRETARRLGADLAEAGVAVISGLAFGIDGCAHHGALDAGGLTVAVLGCGPDVAYPAAYRSLWRRICERGLVLSELPPGATPWRWTFPARNRIVAGLSDMTVVVEAALRSGTMSTARFAGEFDRKVGAVRGPESARTSAGPNALLSGGAHLVRNADDVLGCLRDDQPPPPRRVPGVSLVDREPVTDAEVVRLDYDLPISVSVNLYTERVERAIRRDHEHGEPRPVACLTEDGCPVSPELAERALRVADQDPDWKPWE